MKDNLINKAYRKLENYFLSKADVRKLNVHAVSKGSGAKSQELIYEAESVQAQSLKDWSVAILTATDPETPDKSNIKKLYDNLWLDNHLVSIIESRILYCKRSPFKIVNANGDENLELSKLFERTWFEDFIEFTLMKTFTGTSLIEVWEIDPETKELKEVEEIPMTHFNAKKGIIVKTPGDSEGWSYKEGELSRFYIQVGKDTELGMLAYMAPIVLAKKLGFGSWLDFLEKYGVGNLFITTDREDDGRLIELANAAKNFKSSGFMVGRGQEKFEIKGGDGGNVQHYDSMIDRANSEMSKRVLGGSGLTDEKSFVGSTDIQFRLAKDRFMSDKLLVKNVINQQLIPRLIKLSPAYSGFNGHTFEWDEAESQTAQEIADLISKIAPYFELDHEEITQKIGLTILGKKNTEPAEAPTNNEVDKKKSLSGK